MTLCEQLIGYWSGQPIAIRAGADPQEIRAFEARYQLTLPPDIREYYSCADGFEQRFDPERKQYYCDQNGFNFYPISKVSPIAAYDDRIHPIPDFKQ